MHEIKEREKRLNYLKYKRDIIKTENIKLQSKRIAYSRKRIELNYKVLYIQKTCLNNSVYNLINHYQLINQSVKSSYQSINQTL